MPFVLPAAAQDTLSLRDAVSRALSTHPLLQAGEARVSVAQGFHLQAGLRPNPRAIVQTENWRARGEPAFRPGEDLDIYAYLLQPLETAGKRARRLDLAATGLRRAELERELISRQVAARVRAAYWAAVGAARVHALLLQDGQKFQQVIEYHEVRVREGAMAEADLLKVRLEGERLAVAANTASLEAERARIVLFREMGATAFPPVRFTESLESPEAPPAVRVETALENRTEVKLARAALDQAQANLRLQKALGKPDVEVSAGYKRTGGFDTVLAGVQVPLPVSNRNQGSIAAGEAEARAAASELAAAEALVRAEVSAASTESTLRYRQVTGLMRTLLAQAEESSRIAMAAYREGGADLLRLLDSERVRIDAQALYHRTLAEYRQSLAALETALGIMP